VESPSFRRENRGRQMRLSEVAAGAAVVCMLLALLTWLSLRGISTDSPDYSAQAIKGSAAGRSLALAAINKGATRTEAAKIGG
jgi:hypothetical protein